VVAEVALSLVRQAIRIGAIGLLVGLAGALAATRVLETLLFDVSPGDPVTFVTVSVLLAGVVLLAAYVPARRATRIDPMLALRAE
jgi:putative ABC transport system permease protein